ncbi:MAG: cation transporter [Bacteroidetes bacterium]|nr:cation transporter [Bacteroidota bacterium]
MKILKNASLIAIALFTVQSTIAQTNVTDTISVNGNCGSCKKNIEKSALAAGASTANWDKKNKLLVVNYDPSKISTLTIEKAVAGAGYDTQDVKANESAYKQLDECCQYERKELSAPKKNK